VYYSAAFMRYFLNTPHAGQLKCSDIIVLKHHSKNPFDQFCFTLSLDDDILRQVRFNCSTTPALIACGEYVSQYIEGGSIDAALSLQKEQILQELELGNRYIHIVDLIVRLLQSLKKDKEARLGSKTKKNNDI
jgi:NifU-like protein involved in Fe-S cluster formation